MSRRKCTLCGGKLDGRGICTECGLNSRKSEENYRVNRSSCDGQPMTHVHTEKKEQKPSVDEQPVYRRENKNFPGMNKKVGKMLAAAAIMLTVAGIIIPLIEEYGYEIRSKMEDWGANKDSSYDEDPYADVEAKLKERGDKAEYELTSGQYIVGVHIPEGKYKSEVTDGFDVVQVSDYENDIFLYEYEKKEGKNYLDDIRLYQGALVKIASINTIKLKSDNAQTQDMSYAANPVTESFTIQAEETKEAGIDFEAGVYDLTVIRGAGAAEWTVYNDAGEERYNKRLYVALENGSDGKWYKNIILPAGAKIGCEKDLAEEFEVIMTPSEIISSTDYQGFYEY